MVVLRLLMFFSRLYREEWSFVCKTRIIDCFSFQQFILGPLMTICIIRSVWSICLRSHFHTWDPQFGQLRSSRSARISNNSSTFIFTMNCLCCPQVVSVHSRSQFKFIASCNDRSCLDKHRARGWALALVSIFCPVLSACEIPSGPTTSSS